VERQLEYVLRTVEERGVRFVRLWFTDVLGFLKSVEITPAELEVALEEGMTFDGSTIQGYSRIQESDMLAKPDPNTFELLPNHDSDTPVARMFCDVQTFAGEPYKVEPLDTAGYFDLTAHDLGSQLRKQTVLRLEAMGIPVEYGFHENGPSQHEIDLRYTDALTMADNIMTVRLLAKEVAHDHGVHCTFMPKPITGAFGSGMHSHLSLFEGDVNAFHDPGDEHGLSKVAKGFIAGLLTHAREITAVTNQWVNSYKRLIPGYEAPVYICWARNNRSALVRVPLPKAGKNDSTRIEFRSPDPACNPYLAFSVMLAAGLRGIEEGYDLPPEATDNIYEMTPEERMAEWAEYKAYVTPFEIDRYLRTL
jgi:glutamine synthetase